MVWLQALALVSQSPPENVSNNLTATLVSMVLRYAARRSDLTATGDRVVDWMSIPLSSVAQKGEVRFQPSRLKDNHAAPIGPLTCLHVSGGLAAMRDQTWVREDKGKA